MIKRKHWLVVLAVLVSVNVTFLGYRLFMPRLELFWLEHADPVSDAATAIRRKDLRLVCVSGFGPVLPGTEGIDVLSGGCSYWCVPYTSDASSNRTVGRLNDLGYRYAGEYSRYLIAHAEPGAICRGKKQD